MHLAPAEIASLRRGLQHFRAGEYFAAHDDWEAVWQGMRGHPRTFWQAMIQLVVGAYHLRNGNRKGCESLWNKALNKCDELAQTYDNEVPAPLLHLMALLSTCLEAVQDHDEPWPHLAAFATSVLSEAWFTFR
ncbi:hypothetical protein NKDENANG_01706 [Candidatus Entotheonellaceae bacterium PAL068K]